MKNIIQKSISDSVLVGLYIFMIGIFMHYTPILFGQEEEKNILIPMMMLTLLVLSAAITGSLVFGRSVMWYMDGNKEDALKLLAAKFVVLLVIFVIFSSLLYFVG